MCDMEHGSPAFRIYCRPPEIRALIAETERLTRRVPDAADRVEQLRPAFARLLAAEGWLPDEYAQPDFKSRMGGGIGQYALYRAENGSLCLFALVVPSGADACARPLGVGTGRHLPRRAERDDLSSPRRWARRRGKASLRSSNGRSFAKASSTHCCLRRMTFTTSRPFRDAVDLDSSPRQRHRVCLAASLRTRGREGDRVPIGLQQCALSGRPLSAAAAGRWAGRVIGLGLAASSADFAPGLGASRQASEQLGGLECGRVSEREVVPEASSPWRSRGARPVRPAAARAPRAAKAKEAARHARGARPVPREGSAY